MSGFCRVHTLLHLWSFYCHISQYRCRNAHYPIPLMHYCIPIYYVVCNGDRPRYIAIHTVLLYCMCDITINSLQHRGESTRLLLLDLPLHRWTQWPPQYYRCVRAWRLAEWAGTLCRLMRRQSCVSLTEHWWRFEAGEDGTQWRVWERIWRRIYTHFGQRNGGRVLLNWGRSEYMHKYIDTAQNMTNIHTQCICCKMFSE